MSKFDGIIADALNGAGVEGVLSRLRATAETPLINSKEKLQQSCDDVKKLRASIGSSDNDDNHPETLAGSVIASCDVALQELKDDLNRAIKTEGAFRIEHGIVRNPIDPSVVMSVLTIGVYICVEAFGGASFFLRSAMSPTPAAALITSTTIAAANVIFSCGCGFFIGRWLNYGANALDHDAIEYRRARWLARFFAIPAIAVIIGFQLAVALVRSQETLTNISFSWSAIVEMLGMLDALCLLLIGSVLSALSWYKGLSAFSDPYPYYSLHHNAIVDARETLLDFQEDMKEQIESSFDDAIDDAKKTQKTCIKATMAYNAAVDQSAADKRSLVKQVSLAGQNLAAEIGQVLDLYRAAGGIVDDNFDIKNHCSFQYLLDVEVPEHLPVPEGSLQTTSLRDAKTKALERLAQVLSGDSQPNKGEKP